MKKERTPNLAMNISTMRRNSGLTLEQSAKKLGLKGKTSFLAYEKGYSEPNIKTLMKMSTLFKESVDDILFTIIPSMRKPIYKKCISCGNSVKSESGRPLSSNYCNKCYWD